MSALVTVPGESRLDDGPALPVRPC